ncbi:MAG: ABC transporter substrate-binding protein [Anaerolineae bacterium]|nr:ABC transporter substrate-binding protein [Anaerolineae bacterium]NUQ05673.1 ABC transporter substrate-binding protein [Anaerolineae bacterium]
MRKLAILFCVILAGALLLSVSPLMAQDSSITVAIGGDPTTLDPQAADDGNERAVNDNIYETLLTRDASMALQPLLAEGYEQIDATTWQFTLKSGISFTNGEPMNAEAVAFSINRNINPEFNSEQLSFFETITGASVVDDLTVSITTNGPDPILPARMYWLKIVPPVAAQADGFAENPVGTGPYKFVSWSRGQQIELEANAEYWGGAPSISRVVIRPIPEESTRLAALQAGEVDFVRDLIPEQIDQAPVVKHIPGLEFPIVRLNNKDGILTDVRIRQAINYAVDKEAIAEALYGGYAVVAQAQVINSSHFGFNPDVQAYPYAPDMARQLLAEAGYSGEPIQFIGEAGRWLKDRELIEVVAAMLTDVGITVDVQILEWSNYLDLLFAAENQPSMIFVANDNTLFDADRTFSGYYSCEGRVSSYCNDEVTQLINTARTETDSAARLEMYHRVVELTREDAAFLFLVNLENIYGLSERLEWEPRQDGKILFAQMTLK